MMIQEFVAKVSIINREIYILPLYEGLEARSHSQDNKQNAMGM